MRTIRFASAGVLSLALTIGVTGCVTMCDDCDNFPVPANLGTTMAPGTYTGPPTTIGGSQTRNRAPQLIDNQAPSATNAPTGSNAASSIPLPPPAEPPAPANP